MTRQCLLCPSETAVRCMEPLELQILWVFTWTPFWSGLVFLNFEFLRIHSVLQSYKHACSVRFELVDETYVRTWTDVGSSPLVTLDVALFVWVRVESSVLVVTEIWKWSTPTSWAFFVERKKWKVCSESKTLRIWTRHARSYLLVQLCNFHICSSLVLPEAMFDCWTCLMNRLLLPWREGKRLSEPLCPFWVFCETMFKKSVAEPWKVMRLQHKLVSATFLLKWDACMGESCLMKLAIWNF